MNRERSGKPCSDTAIKQNRWRFACQETIRRCSASTTIAQPWSARSSRSGMSDFEAWTFPCSSRRTSGPRIWPTRRRRRRPRARRPAAGRAHLVGGALGWLAGIGALAIPGVGPFIAAGPIMAALAGGAVGGAVGGVCRCPHRAGYPRVRSQTVRRQSSEGRSAAVRSLRRCRVDQAGKGSARANGRRGHRIDGRKTWRLPEVRSADASRVHLAGSGGAAGPGPAPCRACTEASPPVANPDHIPDSSASTKSASRQFSRGMTLPWHAL